jgi:hypothetical protein
MQMASILPPTYAPGDDIPRDLRLSWLNFHHARLCRGVDTVFVFNPKGMEVWCRVEDRKNYRKFLEILAPLESSYQVDLYTTWASEETKEAKRDPPPSVWNNAELRSYLRDPFLTGGSRMSSSLPFDVIIGGRSGFLLKQRLLMFVEETLEWRTVLLRYAMHLPGLTWTAFDPAAPAGSKEKAAAVCLDHAREIGKHIRKIFENLEKATPKANGLERKSQKQAFEGEDDLSPFRMSLRLSGMAQSVARSIYRFFYPEMHSVGLIELREPLLLDSLTALERDVEAYRHAVEVAVRR